MTGLCWAATLLFSLLIMLAVALAGAVKGADPDQVSVRMGIFVGLGALALWLSQMMLHAACKAG